MTKQILLFVLILLITITTSQDIETNRIDDESNEINVESGKEDLNPFVEAAASFMQSNNAPDIGNVLSKFIQQDGGKAVESLLMGAAQNPDATNQILSGIGSMLNQNNGGAALDPAIIGNMISMMGNTGGKQGQDHSSMLNMVASMLTENSNNKNDQLNIGSLVGSISNMIQETGENPLNLLMDGVGSFFGPDAKQRENDHASHAYLLPPFLEKAHLYFDHFKHTELYKALWRITGGEKFYNMFAVDGKFDFDKFFNRLENKAFRRHWISVATKKITDIIAVIMDPHRHKTYVNTIVSLVNGFLRSMDFPKSTLFDITRPTETLTSLIQYFFNKYLNMKIEARQYVKPVVVYVQDIIRIAQKKGFLLKDGINSQELAHKLTDTLNLEIIEPIARVWRAFRFAKRVPECDKYVMCYINQEDPNEKLSLPGLKTSLSKTASLLSGWFLSQKTGTSFWTFYSTINDENDCSVRFYEKCNQFHEEEKNVHAEYEHTEL